MYPEYECNTRTGETRIKAFTTNEFKFEKLRFVKKKRRIARIVPRLRISKYYDQEYIWEIDNNVDTIKDLDTLYNLIKADLVEVVE